MSLNVDGLISGLDTSGIIEQLLNLERRPITLVNSQAELARARQTAYLDLSARFLNVQVSARRLASPTIFSSVQVASSNESRLLASASEGVPPGSYTFRVAQLARASQHTSTGFADANETPVGGGTLSIEVGGGFVEVATELDDLNGGAGVTRGLIRITDGSGSASTIDLSSAITVNDVIDRINETVGLQVTARLADDGSGLVLAEDSGLGELLVEDLSGLDTAADLGIVGSSTGGELVGTVVRAITEETRLAALSDGLGLRSGAGDDIEFTARDGSSFGIDLNGLTSVGALIQAIEDASGGSVTLSVDGAGSAFVLTDNTGGSGDLIVANGAQGTAAEDLGLATAGTAAASLTGTRVLAGINDVLLSTLNGGSGFGGGSIDLQDRNGVVTTVDLSGAETLQSVIRSINESGAAVIAAVNTAGNGLSLRDTSGGSGTFSVSEVGGGSAASELGIVGTATTTTLQGTDLNPRYIHENTRVDSLNGGRGVSAGSIRITDTQGNSFNVNLGQEDRLDEVLRDINGSAAQGGSALRARINDAGNGIVLEDPSGGSTTLRVQEVNGGNTARDLNLFGSSTTGSLDGAFQQDIEITATDTLQDVLDKVEDLNLGVSVSIVNDGSSNSPFRLNIVSSTSGVRGRLLVSTQGDTELGFSRTSQARDGVLFYGETSAGSEAILIRSRDNTYRDIVEGLTVTALQVDENPVSVNVSRDSARVSDELAELVEKINGVLGEMDSLTDFNVETEQRGLLLGDGTIRNAKRQFLRGLSAPLANISNDIALLSQIGIRVTGDRVTFSRSQFEAALEENPDAVESLFTARRPLSEDVDLDDFNDGRGVRAVSGSDFKVLLRDGTEIEVDVTSADDAEDVVNLINSAASGSGLTATLDSSRNRYILNDSTTGTETFRVTAMNSSSVANDLGLNRSADVEGGGTLSGFEINLTGDVGVMSRFDDTLESLVNPDGILQRRADGLDSRILDLEDRIEQLEERVARREEFLRRQFASLEQSLSRSQNTLAQLTASLGSLRG